MWRWKEFHPQALEFTEQVIARIITRADIHGMSAQDVIINPGEAVVYIRDGKIEDVMTQTRLKDVGGGLFNYFKNVFDKGEDIQLLFIDTAPFDLEFPVNATSKDYVEVTGKQVVRVQISTDSATKLINLMNRTNFYADKTPDGAKKAVSSGAMEGTPIIKWFTKKLFAGDYNRVNRVLLKDFVQEMLKDEIGAMVMSSEIAKVNAADFRGNLEVIKSIETKSTIELRKTFDMWGFSVLKAFTVWDKNAYDGMMQYHREYAMQVESWDLNQETQHRGNIAKMRRDYDLRRKEQEQRWDHAYGELMGREGLKTAGVKEDLHRTDLKVDAAEGQKTRMTKGTVLRSGVTADEDLRQRKDTETQDTDHYREQTNAELDAKRKAMMDEVDRDRLELEMAMKAKEQLHQQKMTSSQQDIDYKQQQMAMQTGSTERIMSKALESGAADSASLKEMMRQQTMQKMADRESDKVDSVAKADAARYNMDTARQVQDRDRDYQLKMAGQSSDMMQSAKQNVPHTLVQGGKQPSTHTHVQAGGSTPIKGGTSCPTCGAGVQAGWKACPACGNKIASAPTCPQCGANIQAGWKACPGCGNQL